MIEQTHFPFTPKLRVIGDGVEAELWENMKKIAEFYKLDTARMSASISFRPNPWDNGKTHYLAAEVTYYGEVSKQ
jgi:hypothetical protein